jgi:pseudaminic acid biosynthesis-associated methylase
VKFSRRLTKQEEFWAGSFGSEYTKRNSSGKQGADAMQALAIEIRNVTRPINTVLELGANSGLNITALKHLLPSADFTGVEINEAASEQLKLTGATVHNLSLFDFEPNLKYDLVLIRGVLIHLDPEMLEAAYKKIAATSNKYVLIAEYYNPVPVALKYHDEDDRLFKRDFAGEFMKAHNEFELRDYGFHYRHGHYFGDDLTWFLLERSSSAST